MEYDLIAVANDATFELRGFVNLYDQLSSHLDTACSICVDLQYPSFFGLAGVVPLIALISEYSARGWVFDIAIPQEPLMAAYWRSTGWLQAILEEELPNALMQKTYTPIVRFDNHHTLNAAISDALNVLSISSEYPTGVLSAIEWTLNEIADNVLVHSQTLGWMQVIARPSRKSIDFVVADCGIGIPTSLRTSYPQLASDGDALNLAIERGVTRDKTVGQGNGLAGSVRIAEAMGGWLTIVSESAMLRIFDNNKRKLLGLNRFPGTFVEFTIPTTATVDLTDALWGHTPSSTFEFSHVNRSGILFMLANEDSAFGNRASGADLAIRLRNIMNENPNELVIIDFAGIDLTSASFLDEFLGKLMKRFGIASFHRRVQLINMAPFIERTLDEVLAQRMREE
jgi:hypothetical protein